MFRFGFIFLTLLTLFNTPSIYASKHQMNWGVRQITSPALAFKDTYQGVLFPHGKYEFLATKELPGLSKSLKSRRNPIEVHLEGKGLAEGINYTYTPATDRQRAKICVTYCDRRETYWSDGAFEILPVNKSFKYEVEGKQRILQRFAGDPEGLREMEGMKYRVLFNANAPNIRFRVLPLKNREAFEYDGRQLSSYIRNGQRAQMHQTNGVILNFWFPLGNQGRHTHEAFQVEAFMSSRGQSAAAQKAGFLYDPKVRVLYHPETQCCSWQGKYQDGGVEGHAKIAKYVWKPKNPKTLSVFFEEGAESKSKKVQFDENIFSDGSKPPSDFHGQFSLPNPAVINALLY